MSNPSLFETTHTGHMRARRESEAPHNGQRNSRAAAGKVASQTLCSMYAAALLAAGPEGLTDREAAARLTQLRGVETERCTINGRRADLNNRDKYPDGPFVFDSGRNRTENGRSVTVYVHRVHHRQQPQQEG